MSKLTKDEAKYYVDMLEQARGIVASVGDVQLSPDLVAAVFEKIASPLVYLRQDLAKGKEALQGDFSNETPRVNDEKVPENESEKGGATIGYERKARLLAEGWKESKNPDILYKRLGNTTFFEDTTNGRSWISKHAEAEK